MANAMRNPKLCNADEKIVLVKLGTVLAVNAQIQAWNIAAIQTRTSIDGLCSAACMHTAKSNIALDAMPKRSFAILSHTW
jgi:hypothetical protein